MKSTNILLDGQGKARLADFGKSVMLQRGQVEVEFHKGGTPGYCDPSFILSSIIRKETDVYGMAMTMLATLARRPAAVKKAGRLEHRSPSSGHS